MAVRFLTVKDLSREQLIELKQAFMVRLANEGKYGQYFGVDWDAPSYNELACADDIITDMEMYTHYSGISFVPDDFVARREAGREVAYA